MRVDIVDCVVNVSNPKGTWRVFPMQYAKLCDPKYSIQYDDHLFSVYAYTMYLNCNGLMRAFGVYSLCFLVKETQNFRYGWGEAHELKKTHHQSTDAQNFILHFHRGHSYTQPKNEAM